MQTEIVSFTSNPKLSLFKAINALQQNSIFVFPTDTVYGIGCLYDNIDGVQEIFKLKTRSFNKPLSAYFSNIEMAMDYIQEPNFLLKIIADQYLPGGLTIVVPKNNKINNLITGNAQTIGIRIPKNNFVLELVEKIGKPLVGTSANISNQPSAKTSKETADYFNGLLPLIISDDQSIQGIESTVISLNNSDLKLLREGAIPFKKIQDYIKSFQ